MSIPNSSNSEKENCSSKSNLPCLTQNKWYESKFKFLKILVSKDHKELLDPKWTIKNIKTKQYQKKTALGTHLLFNLVEHEIRE